MKTLQVTKYKGYHTIQLDHGKVNAIDTTMVEELLSIWKDCRSKPQPPGILLTGRPHCFSAGLNLFHQLELKKEGVRHFWKTYHLLIKEIIEYPAPVVCAITGYAPAGATILSLCADYRIMGTGPKHQIGMHEFVMSLQIPKVLAEIYGVVIGEQRAWKAVMNKRLFDAQEAVAIGLVHEDCDVEEVLPKSKDKMSELLSVKADVFSQTKEYLNTGLRNCVDYDDAILEGLLDDIMSSTGDMEVWQGVKQYLHKTKSK